MSPTIKSPRKAKVKALYELTTPKKKQSVNTKSSTTPLTSKFSNLTLASPSTTTTAKNVNVSPRSGSDKENYQNIAAGSSKKKKVSARKRLPLGEINNDDVLFAPRTSIDAFQNPPSASSSKVPQMLTDLFQDMNVDDETCKSKNSPKKRNSIPRKNSKASSVKHVPLEDETSTWTIESKSTLKMTLRRTSSRSTTPQRIQQPSTIKKSGLEEEYHSGDDTVKHKPRGLEEEYESEADNVTKKNGGLEEEYESEEDTVINKHHGLEEEYDSDNSLSRGTVKNKNFGLEQEYDSETDDDISKKKHHGLEDEYDSGNDDPEDIFHGLEQEYEESDDSDASSIVFERRQKVTPKRYTVETFEEEPITAELEVLLNSISQMELETMEEDAQRLAEMREKRERNPLMKIYPLFHTSAPPDILLKRDEQCKIIEKFIKQSIAQNSSVHNRTIYISGVPGTGKTACVTKVVQKLKAQKRPILKFNYVYVNGLELVKPQHVFSEIYNALNPSARPIASKKAREKLSQIFTLNDSKRIPILLVIDELDMLCTKSQDVVYDIFDWASTEEARLSVIAIANTLDLPERVLKQKVSSRMGYNRLTFQPYDYEEITEILKHRIKKFKISFKDGAFGLISRKVAAVSGDLRKALELIRRAIEIAVENDDETLSIDHANAAVKEGLQSLPTLFTKSLSLQQEILLRSIIQEIRATSLEELDFVLVYDCYRRNCLASSEEPMEMCSATGLLSSLKTMGYIDIKIFGLVSRRISLRTCVDEIEYLLKQMKIKATDVL